MNLRLVLHQFGLLLLVLATAMGLVTLLQVAGVLGEVHAERLALYALLTAAAITAAIGAVCWWTTRRVRRERFNRKDALLLVASIWLIGAGLAALPYYFWAHAAFPVNQALLDGGVHPFDRYADCYFEAMSGLSTTGATVLGAEPYDIESLPRGLLLWRALTHWLGGLGIVVLFVAVLPSLGMGGKMLFQIEKAGPQRGGVTPRARETARVLWLIYVCLTIAQTFLLRWAGMTWFDAACHSLSDMATGGLSTRNASVGAYYDTAAVDLIVIVFMILAGVNFGLYYQLVNRNVKAVFRDPELRAYLGIITAATLVIAAWIYGDTGMTTAGEMQREGGVASVRDSLFQVVAIQTGTGFSTVDYERWPFGPRAILVVLMFFGGMSGSTTGGLKVIRLLIAARVLWAEFERIFRPNLVQPTRIGPDKTAVDPDLARGVFVFFVMVAVIFAFASIALMLLEPDGSISYDTAASATISTMMNVGPGIAGVGPTDNYGFFSTPSKFLLSFLMALGRLEFYAILVLLHPRFWSDR
jgi:trk system potassium uptake protein TrkH